MTSPKASRLALAATAALLALSSASQVSAAPPFAFGSFAEARMGSSVIGSGGGQVRVGLHLSPGQACLDVVSVATGPGYYDNPGLDALNAAPVAVTVAPGNCGSEWNREWLRFSVPHPKTSDILGLVVRDGAGRTLHAERLAISTTEPSTSADD